MEKELVNRVANSSLISIDLENYYVHGERVVIDMREILFQEMILREGDFRAWVKETNWETFRDKYVAITCSADAIIPQWAYMIIASKLVGIASFVSLGSLKDLEKEIFYNKINTEIDPELYRDKSVVVKGCFDKTLPQEAYVWLTVLLKPFVKSIMYGEPCSTVPVFKAPRKI